MSRTTTMSKFNKLKPVFVKWRDSMGSPRWHARRDFEEWACDPGDMRAESVGFLAYEDDECIVLVQSVNPFAVADGLKIPRTAIRAIRRLK